MAIDLEALRISAACKSENCVVSRRWLRQVLAELEETRVPATPGPVELDLVPPEQKRG